MRTYMDWEFLEDGRTIEPISVALVREDAGEYYAVNADMPWKRIMRHDWLRAHVVPSLPVIKTDGIRPLRKPFLDRSNPDVKGIKQIASDVRHFIVNTPNVELWADWGAHDHVALCQLFGSMVDLPKGIPMWTHEFRQEVEAAGSPDLPSLPNARPHHSLDDARELKMRHEFLARLNSDRGR